MADQRASWQDILQQLAGGGSREGGSSSRKEGWQPSAEMRAEAYKRFTKRTLIVFIIAVILLMLAAYWWFHPPISIHSVDTWTFVTIFILLPTFAILRMRSTMYKRGTAKVTQSTKKAKRFVWLSFIPVAVVAVWVVGAILSSVIVPGNAERYSKVLVTQNSDFSTDIHEVNYQEIPIIDRDSAVLLGNRAMGSIPEYVSQFEISDIYSQINFRGHPVRVSPLGYADIFKWFTNREAGIPAYVLVDMTTQDPQIVKLEQPIHYSQSEPLIRNIDRHVQLKYPFYIFDQKSFEIDEEGKPWWVCPVQTRTIGLFGGTTISKVILCDATTGECQELEIEDCPTWIDRVYPADLLVEQYNWSGAYQRGWINSWLGQEGVVQTTPGANGLLGYNYIAKDDDVWVYTGVTSAVSDNSIVGFVLINQRTAESHFYPIAGATEASAMNSAQGQVQHLGYQATFPLLLNINSQPTYFMALKDNAGLVKMYAMLDIQRYQNVAVGDTLAECQQSYKALLATNGVEMPTEPEPDMLKASGKVERIAAAVINGNSHFYITLSGDKTIYDCALPGLLDVLNLQVGDTVELGYRQSETTGSVVGVVVDFKITKVAEVSPVGGTSVDATSIDAASTSGSPASDQSTSSAPAT